MKWLIDLFRWLFRKKPKPPKPKPEPKPEPPPFKGSERFLSKPVSNDGKLCILLPYSIKLDNINVVELSTGNRAWKIYYPEPNPDGTPRNGGRVHCRFRSPGSVYGGRVQVKCHLKEGYYKAWTVPNMAQRYEE